VSGRPAATLDKQAFRGREAIGEAGDEPAFLLQEEVYMSTIQADIEARLAEVEPDVEVLLAEFVGGDLVRLFIDHPQGVTLDLCERVTNHLPEIREQYALEVSSPGVQRPLTKPEHFRRYLGRRAKVRTRGGSTAPPARRTFTGELINATEEAVTVAADSGVVSIAYADIHRSNLVGD
jgi:ribosome maturation factor RimP